MARFILKHTTVKVSIFMREPKVWFFAGGNIVTQEALDEEKRTKSGGVATWVAPGVLDLYNAV